MKTIINFIIIVSLIFVSILVINAISISKDKIFTEDVDVVDSSKIGYDSYPNDTLLPGPEV